MIVAGTLGAEGVHPLRDDYDPRAWLAAVDPVTGWWRALDRDDVPGILVPPDFKIVINLGDAEESGRLAGDTAAAGGVL